MYHQTSSLCARRAAAFILLFVLVSQCPYSPYGAPVIRHPHSPQGQSAMNAIEKQVERSSGVNTTNITPFEEIFRHSDAHELRRAPGPPTQAVAHAALNEVAQQKKASSIPRRQQQTD
uniref:Secreted protein n=1 Tax=Octactis speculum TaxID=3111310 RepID=A0A7S2BVU0_9STRA|mmetsp:Transcript_28090/g.38467  ORF Transcript_28090/g.38467 Transcript_28090/m.38467 type:complete len:118 (+) Transcript_28090:129-482(+)